MRQRRVLHARDLVQPTPQFNMEVSDPRLWQAGPQRIQLEQQDVVTVEAERNRLEIRERPHEQTRRDQ
jgi:hypothetical protein